MINFSFCHLILLLELVGVYTLEKRLKELLAFSHLKRRGRNIKRERERGWARSAVLLPFSPLTMGAFHRVIDRFRVPEPQEQASKEPRLRFVTPPSKSIFSRGRHVSRTGIRRATLRALL